MPPPNSPDNRNVSGEFDFFEHIEGQIEVGDEVGIVGFHHETLYGDVQFQASFVECLRTEFEIEIDRPEKKKHKKNHDRHDDNGRHSLPSRKILAEITAIRTLLKDRTVPSKKVQQSQHDCVLKELKELREVLQAD